MKKELKTTIFDTVSTLRKLFAKLLDTNESKDRKITELKRQVANTNAERCEVTGRTSFMYVCMYVCVFMCVCMYVCF